MDMPPYATDRALTAIRQSFRPGDLIPHLRKAGVRATILVQAVDGEAENESLLEELRKNSWIAGVVGWVPLPKPERVETILSGLAAECKFVGVRHLVNIEPDPDWIIRDDVIDGLRVVAQHDLTFDYVAILPRHLQHVPRLADRVPKLRIVIDHLGKPPISAANFEPWASLLSQAASAPTVFAKLSGLDVGRADKWSAAHLAPYWDHALRVFGPDRLMFGSNWPISRLQGGYAKVWRETQVLLSGLPMKDKQKILAGTAMQAYRLDPEILPDNVRA
jgi:L-fuconolactonase